MEIIITLDTLLEIADEPLRKWLLLWQEDTGDPLEFDGDVMKCSIDAVACVNLTIELKEKK